MRLKSTGQKVIKTDLINQNKDGENLYGVFIPTPRRNGPQHHLQFVHARQLVKEK